MNLPLPEASVAGRGIVEGTAAFFPGVAVRPGKATGKELNVRVAHAFTARDESIVRFEQFVD
ncbi:hypothetical protein [Streptomyces sp. NPDC002088]|uniref:hypothetical protein n=1 Tax=Streptomyces sp. NPDC002088 TaxID=3154665 RepID=UPI00331A4CDE